MIAAVHGTGRHRWDLSDEDAKIALLVIVGILRLFTTLNNDLVLVPV